MRGPTAASIHKNKDGRKSTRGRFRRRSVKTISLHRAVFWVVAAVGATLPAFGTGIVFTCNTNIDATHGGTCGTLNTTIANLYSSTFSDANASIYIQYGSTGLGSSLQYYTDFTYSSYYASLAANESGANDVTAVNSLGGGTNNPVASGSGVAVTSALAGALGLAGFTYGISTATNNPTCALGTAGCYNGIITISNGAALNYRDSTLQSSQYDFYSTVEHEVDEILGTSSCIATVGSAPGLSDNCKNYGNTSANGVGAADLFRYSAPAARSYISQGNGTPAYFSINGGTPNIAEYNNSTNGADYGDWNSALLRVQNAYATNGAGPVDITTDGGSEIMVLDAVGYNLAEVPEPGTVVLLGSSLATLAGLRLRRRNRRS